MSGECSSASDVSPLTFTVLLFSMPAMIEHGIAISDRFHAAWKDSYAPRQFKQRVIGV
jgi:hypothetical protein